jgi:hypothetical protein
MFDASASSWKAIIVCGARPDDVALGKGRRKQGHRPALWDGRVAQRIVAILARELA